MILLSSMASITVGPNEIHMSWRDNDRNRSVVHAQEHALDDMGQERLATQLEPYRRLLSCSIFKTVIVQL